MALDKDDRIQVHGHIDVPGLEDGFNYRITGFKTFQEQKHYVLYCEDLREFTKIPVKTVDSMIGTENTIEVVN